MRRRNKEEENNLTLSRPGTIKIPLYEGTSHFFIVDIRTSYVLFLLSFVESTTSSSVKADFLEQRQAILAPLFRGLNQDAYPLVRKVLEICWTGLWSDPKIRRTLKIRLFNEATIAQVFIPLSLVWGYQY